MNKLEQFTETFTKNKDQCPLLFVLSKTIVETHNLKEMENNFYLYKGMQKLLINTDKFQFFI